MCDRSRPIQIKIERFQVGADHPFDFFEVVLTDGKTSWVETYDEKELGVSLRSVQATASFFGTFLEIPPVPQEPSDKFVRFKKLPVDVD